MNESENNYSFLVSELIQDALSVSGILGGKSEKLTEPSDKHYKALIILNGLMQRLLEQRLIPSNAWLKEGEIEIPLFAFNDILSDYFSLYFIQFLVFSLADSLLKSSMGQGLDYPIVLKDAYGEYYNEISMMAAPTLKPKRMDYSFEI